MKVINPCESENEKLCTIETKIKEFYNYCDSVDITKLDYLNKFITKDIENEVTENPDIDLMSLLEDN